MIVKQHCKAPTEHIKGRCVSLCVYVSSHYQVTVLSHSWTIIPSLRVLLTVKITLLRRPWVLCWVTPAAVLAHTLHTLRSKMMAIHNNKRMSACVTCVVCNVYSYQSRNSIGTRGETHIASTNSGRCQEQDWIQSFHVEGAHWCGCGAAGLKWNMKKIEGLCEVKTIFLKPSIH